MLLHSLLLLQYSHIKSGLVNLVPSLDNLNRSVSADKTLILCSRAEFHIFSIFIFEKCRDYWLTYESIIWIEVLTV